MDREAFDYWCKYADSIVKKSEFDDNIYISIYSRSGKSEQYFSSQQLTVRLNDSKVIVLSKNCKKILHRNFKLMTEVI